MQDLVSIDPGLNGCGFALWKSAKLIQATYVPNTPKGDFKTMRAALLPFGHDRPFISVELAIELPQVYVASRSKGDPNDLINLAMLVGYLAASFKNFSLYKPHAWKGQVPKDIMEDRITKRLDAKEQANLERVPKSLAHNMIDAIGIGLHHLGRLKDRLPK